MMESHGRVEYQSENYFRKKIKLKFKLLKLNKIEKN